MAIIDVAILSHLFVTAINEGLIDANPCQKVKSLKVSQVKDRLVILASLFTGMRLNEVLNFSWNDIDFGKGIIHIFQSKTNKTFDIPLSDCLRTALEAYRAHSTGVRVFGGREMLLLNSASISVAFLRAWA